MSYFPSINQNVLVDSKNTSSTPLASGATFVGTATSTLGVNSIQVSLKTDQNSTVYVDQSPGLVAGPGLVTTSGVNITGSGGTTFLTTFKVGDEIFVAGEVGSRIIATIGGDTAATVTQTFAGESSVAYQYYPWDIADSFSFIASIGNFGVTSMAVNSYERVRVTNIGPTLQNYFRVETCLCPMADALPRALDSDGNLRVGVKTTKDDYGFTVENTPQGESRSVSPYRVVGKQFEFYGSTSGLPDTNFWTTSIANSATVLVQSSTAVLTSGTNTAASAVLYSTKKARYVQANCMRLRGNIQLGDTGTTSNTRRWGATNISNYNFTVSGGTAVVGNIYTNNSQQFIVLQVVNPTSIQCVGTGAPSAGSQTLTFIQGPGSGNITVSTNTPQAVPIDGFWFQLAGAVLSVITCKGGSPTPVASGAFNGAYGTTYAPTTSNTVYEIYWTNSNVYFVVGNKILHTVSASANTLSNTLSLGVFMDNINSGSSTSVTLNSRSIGIARMGVVDTSPKWYYQHGATAGSGVLLKSGPGKLSRAIINGWLTGTTVSLYDSVTTTNPIALIAPTTTGGTHQEYTFTNTYDLDFYNGLYLVTAGSTTDVTIIYE